MLFLFLVASQINQWSQTPQGPQATQEPQTSQALPTNQQTRTAQASLTTTRPRATAESQTSQTPQPKLTTHTFQNTLRLQTNQIQLTAQTRHTVQATLTTQVPQTTQPSVWYPQTCGTVKANLNKTSGWYIIDPDGPEGEAPFQVYCNMTDKDGIGVTVISHDSENRTRVTSCSADGCYSRDVNYIGVSFSQLTALTDVSTYCEQFISYECKASKLFAGNKAWWVSRQGLKMDHWGGSSKSGWCGCAVTGTCAKSNVKCNCDINDNVWREDSGLLFIKDYLPVSQLRFGDTDGKIEEGYHTLGKLKCY